MWWFKRIIFMPKQQLIIPNFQTKAYTCPHCNFNAAQLWKNTDYEHNNPYSNSYNSALWVAICHHCGQRSIWYKKKIIYPDVISVDEPNEDLSQEIKDDYMEAATILQKSPRASAALLRLSIQKLCYLLGKKGGVNEMIADLVKDGLSPQIQKSLDVVRVVGNDAVHPGQIDLKDNFETVQKLFSLVNFIAEKMITEPKRIEELYNSLPVEKISQIKNRDSKK